MKSNTEFTDVWWKMDQLSKYFLPNIWRVSIHQNFPLSKFCTIRYCHWVNSSALLFRMSLVSSKVHYRKHYNCYMDAVIVKNYYTSGIGKKVVLGAYCLSKSSSDPHFSVSSFQWSNSVCPLSKSINFPLHSSCH